MKNEEIKNINIGQLAEKVDNLERSFLEFRGDIRALSLDLRNAQKPNVTNMWMGASVLLVLIGVYGSSLLAPINKDVSRLDEEEKRQAAWLERNVVPLAQHIEMWKANAEHFDAIGKQMASSDQLLAQQNQTSERQIDDINNRIGSTYGLRDVLQDVQKRLDKLEEMKK